MSRVIKRDDKGRIVEYSWMKHFERFIKEECSTDRKILKGCFYTYHYDYHQTPELIAKVPVDILKLYDGRPVVYIMDSYKTKNGELRFWGINFHFMPPKARNIWLAGVDKLAKEDMKKNRRLKLRADILSKVFPKTKICFRQYDPKKIFHINTIDTNKLKEIFKYTPYSHESYIPSTIFKKFELYQP